MRVALIFLLLIGATAASPPTTAPATQASAPINATVCIFIAMDCPISNSYAPEINRIIAEYSPQGLSFKIVYCDADATPEAVAKHAKDYGYSCPIAQDPKHELAARLHATVTPEAVVLSARDDQPLYRGRIDDRYADVGKKRYEATRHDLRDALEAIVHDRAIEHPVTQAVGCEL
ncbi:MAG TPA: thioredoxin-like domain-containing protein [Tepidisphaeraceae bacterium]|nr:thioredoxin-like domain-containing protein [Tepidisphaeraceae bacterium]